MQRKSVTIANPKPARRSNLSLEKAEERKERAVEFLRQVGAEDAAENLEAEPVESYATRKGIRIDENPAGIQFIIGRPIGKRTTAVESVLFDRSVWKAAQAKNWLQAHGMNADQPEPTGPRSHELRYRQRPPSHFQKGSLRTITPGRRNPEDDELQQAKRLYKEFQGRSAKEILEVQQRDVYQKNYAKLGDLVSLVVLDADQKPRRIQFSDRDGVMLAANPAGSQLYCLGGNQDVRPLLEDLGADTSKDYVELGPCIEVEYFTRKAFDQFKPVRYYHHLGEETGDVPVLCFDQLNLQLFFVGGAYYVRPEGIRN